MCVVSMIMDDFNKRWPEPWVLPNPGIGFPPIKTGPTQEEFDQLKKEIEALKDLLKAAKKFDKKTGQPDCEMDEKIELLKKIAKVVGVDMKDVLKKESKAS